jgi:hypothetical protein
MWLIAEYLPTTLFSLKPAWATSSGGKSLLLPTPYAIKMALLDGLCRADGVEAARQTWPAICGLTVALRGPKHIVVSNTFTKILKPRRGEAEEGGAHAGPYQKTIGFREYVFHGGPISIALQTDEAASPALMRGLLQVSYLGKRGGLVQLLSCPQAADDLPDGYVIVADNNAGSFLVDGIMAQLDDTASLVPFEAVDIYSNKNVRLGKERILRHVVLPYRLKQSSKSYTLYERIDT